MPPWRRRVFEMSDGNDVYRTHYLEMALFFFDVHVVAGDDGDSSTMAAVA